MAFSHSKHFPYDRFQFCRVLGVSNGISFLNLNSGLVELQIAHYILVGSETIPDQVPLNLTPNCVLLSHALPLFTSHGYKIL